MPDNPGAVLLLASGALASGDFAAADRLFADAEAVTEHPPSRAQAAHGRACALRSAGNFAAAYGHADRALKILPNDFTGPLRGQIELSRSLCLCELGHPEDAERGFRAAAATFERQNLGSEHDQARIGLGWCFALQGSDHEAVLIFESLVTSPHPLIRSQALNNLAMMRERAGELVDAAELLERDLALARRLSDEHGQVVTQINLSRVLLAAGRPEAARDIAVAALALADRSAVSPALKQRAAEAVATSR